MNLRNQFTGGIVSQAARQSALGITDFGKAVRGGFDRRDIAPTALSGRTACQRAVAVGIERVAVAAP